MALLETLAGPWRKLKTTNFTNASFGTIKSTATRPSGDGVVDWGDEGLVPNQIVLKFFGTDTNNQTLKARVWGFNEWRASPSPPAWDPILLAEFALTLGNIQGAAGCAITASDFEVDTITLTYGNAALSIFSSNAADVRGAYASVDTLGCRVIQVEFDRNSSAASCNGIVRGI